MVYENKKKRSIWIGGQNCTTVGNQNVEVMTCKVFLDDGRHSLNVRIAWGKKRSLNLPNNCNTFAKYGEDLKRQENVVHIKCEEIT